MKRLNQIQASRATVKRWLIFLSGQNEIVAKEDTIGEKVEIPKFTGHAHPDEFIESLSTVERVFDMRDILGPLKVKVAAI